MKGFVLYIQISKPMDKNDDMLRNGSEEEQDVRSEWEEDKGTECEDGNSCTV
jgi:hypothetical protein